MARATANQASLRFSSETTWGETPAGPAMTEARITSESLSHQKQTVTSQEVRSDRMRADVLEVGSGAGGDINFELSYGDFEAFFEDALASTIASTIVQASALTIAASAITGASMTGFVVGQQVRLHNTSTAANSAAVCKVVTASANGMTISGTTLSAETNASITINGRMLRNGTTERSSLIEVNFTDITAVKYFTGMEVQQTQLTVQSQQVVTGVFSFVGEGGTAASVTVASTVTTAGTNTPMTAAANVGNIFENDVVVSTAIQSINLTINGNLRPQPVVGQKTAIGIGAGGFDVTGQLNAYFENITLYDRFIQHTNSSLRFQFKDVDSNVIVVTVPSIYFSGGDPTVTGIDADVFVPLDFVARRDATTDSMIQFDFLPATP